MAFIFTYTKSYNTVYRAYAVYRVIVQLYCLYLFSLHACSYNIAISVKDKILLLLTVCNTFLVVFIFNNSNQAILWRYDDVRIS